MGTHALAPGTVLGRYELLLPIAQGGMATVWAARQRGSRGFSKTVAVKTILPNLSDDPQFEQMFLDEASIASRIHHPNVAEISDLGEQDEVLYLVMEWVDGESLSTLSKHARKSGNDIPLRVGLRIVSAACAGLHAAHELRDDEEELIHLVHRDVSPQNILVSTTGVVKIVDFGVAKALGRAGGTSAGQLKGKVPFMSPEQAKGGEIDRRTDIFALGIILYRIATGGHPFLDEDDIKTLRNIITRPVMSPRTKTPSISVELERVIMRALQKDPQKRYQTAAELGLDIETVLANSGGPVGTDEVATFVRATLGDRDRKRKAELRDAAMRIDEQGAPRARDSVNDLTGMMFTKVNTPPGATTTTEEVTDAVGPPASLRGSTKPPAKIASSKPPAPRTVPPASSSTKGDEAATDPAAPPPEAQVASSPTHVALAASPSVRPPDTVARRTGPGMKALAIAATVVLAIGASVLAVGKLGGAAPSGNTNQTKSDTGRTDAAGAAAPGPAAQALPPAAEPDTRKGTSLSLDDLPDTVPTGGASATVGGVGRGPRTVPPGKSATAAPVAGSPPVKPTGASNVPAVQEPGF